MNFFTHAVVAAKHRNHGHFILGAMLPDFAGMCRTQVVSVGHSALQSGIEYHHRCDSVFHDDPVFRQQTRVSAQRMRERGMPRGASMGASHVAFELVLDGILASNSGNHAPYIDALGIAPATIASVTWSREDAGPAIDGLLKRLQSSGVPTDLSIAEAACTRVVRALAHRPLLAVPPPFHAPLADEIRMLQENIAPLAEDLVARVMAGAEPV